MKKFIFALMGLFSIVSTTLFGLSPSATTQQINTSYLSVADMDLTDPDFRKNVVHPYGKQFSDMWMLMTELGYQGTTKNQVKTVLNKDYIHEYFVNKNVFVAVAADTVKTMTLDSTAVSTLRGHYPQVNDELRWSNGFVGVILATGGTAAAPTFDVYPKLVGANIPATAAGEKIAIYSTSFAEGSAAPAGRKPAFFKTSFGMKISRQSADATNSSIAERLRIIDNESGGIFDIASIDAQARLTHNITNAMLFDVPVTGTAAVAAGIKGVTGLDYAIKNMGGALQTYTPGSFSDTEMTLILNRLEANNGSYENLFFQGHKLFREIEKFYSNPLQAANSAPFVNDAKSIMTKNGSVDGKDLNASITSVTIGGYKFHMLKEREFSDPRTHNITNYSEVLSGFIIPNGEMTTRTDAYTGETEKCPYMELLYLKNNNVDRKFVIELNSGMRKEMKGNNGGVDKTKWDALAEYMFLTTCHNKMIKIEKA